MNLKKQNVGLNYIKPMTGMGRALILQAGISWALSVIWQYNVKVIHSQPVKRNSGGRLKN